MEITATHIHLYAEEFSPDRDALIQEAIAAGVKRFFLPNIDGTTIESLLALERQYPENCFPMMGLHPCSVKENWEEELLAVENQLSQRKFAGIGEIGIDLYWDKTFVNEQEKVFRKQIEIAN